MRVLSFAVLLLAAASAGAQKLPVLLAARRLGPIQAYDPHTLQLIGSIDLYFGLESISVSNDGRRLFLAEARDSGPEDPGGGLYALDLQTDRMCQFSGTGMFVVPSPDGRFLFTQGPHGVEVFDAATLSQAPPMRASGAYNLQPSPDGRWLLGISNSPKWSLAMFDLEQLRLSHQLVFPDGPITGAWDGETLEVLSYTPPGIVQVWSVRPGETRLREPRRIEVPDLHAICNEPVLLTLAGASGHLFLAEAFGYKVDRRNQCPGTVTGGIYTIDVANGSARHIAPSVHVSRLIAAPDGDLYVVDSPTRVAHGNARLLRLDGRTGGILSSALLGAGAWSLTYARIPYGLLRPELVHPVPNCER
ncbi:MAG TPA: hypothetical protein VMI94_16490 [Bryobacteraceae bacterium]|nr:hypothetical protein [Bryobacteraceae bacterium]